MIFGYLAAGLILIAAIIALFNTDDTDKSFWTRSGAYLITDHKTGLQYLAGPKGGITPRLDNYGRHMQVSK